MIFEFCEKKELLGLACWDQDQNSFSIGKPNYLSCSNHCLSSLLTNPYQILLKKGMCHQQIVQDSKLKFQVSHLYILRKVAVRELNLEEPQPQH